MPAPRSDSELANGGMVVSFIGFTKDQEKQKKQVVDVLMSESKQMTPRIMAVYIPTPSPLRDPGTRTMSIPGLGGGEFTRSCLVSKGPRALRKADRNKKKVRFVDESRDGY